MICPPWSSVPRRYATAIQQPFETTVPPLAARLVERLRVTNDPCHGESKSAVKFGIYPTASRAASKSSIASETSGRDVVAAAHQSAPVSKGQAPSTFTAMAATVSSPTAVRLRIVSVRAMSGRSVVRVNTAVNGKRATVKVMPAAKRADRSKPHLRAFHGKANADKGLYCVGGEAQKYWKKPTQRRAPAAHMRKMFKSLRNQAVFTRLNSKEVLRRSRGAGCRCSRRAILTRARHGGMRAVEPESISLELSMSSASVRRMSATACASRAHPRVRQFAGNGVFV